MIHKLPKDLFEAENHILEALSESLKSNYLNFISINVLIEGLKLNPIISRITDSLILKGISIDIIFPDTGATELFKRDYIQHKNNTYSIKEYSLKIKSELNHMLICVAPQPYDYEMFEAMCSNSVTRIVMFNGRLEDNLVGIGSVARKRRVDFIKKWQSAYWLQPLPGGALMKKYPGNWELFKAIDDEYHYVDSFDNKPESELIKSSVNSYNPS